MGGSVRYGPGRHLVEAEDPPPVRLTERLREDEGTEVEHAAANCLKLPNCLCDCISLN